MTCLPSFLSANISSAPAASVCAFVPDPGIAPPPCRIVARPPAGIALNRRVSGRVCPPISTRRDEHLVHER